MTDNNRNDYSDFFKDNMNEAEPTNDNGGREKENVSSNQPDESTYYAYGPYRNQVEPSETKQPNQPIDVTPVYSHIDGNPTSDITPPKPLRTITYGDERGKIPFTPASPGSGNGGSWTTPPKKKSNFKGYFAAFAAGVILVGGLMATADYNNWFTKGGTLASSGNKITQGTDANKNGTSSNATQSSFDTARPDISGIVDQSSKAVVLVESLVKKSSSSQGNSNSPLNDEWFRQFFGDSSGSEAPKTNQDKNTGELQKQGMGTGFIFEDSGYILTNQHVIDGADQVKVTVEGYDKPFVAKVLGTSYELDLACLKIEGPEKFPILPLGNADEVKVGDWVVAIGNPYGFDHTVTVGVLSAKGRPISIPDTKGTRNYENLFQTDASINPGNSGGPLLNMRGEVIGINTAVSSQAQGIGFAIPSSTVSKVVDNLKNNVEIPKTPSPYIGVQPTDIDKDWVTELKLKNTEGAFMQGVERKSPAFAAGIRQYDVVVDIGGKSVKNAQELRDIILTHKVGDKVKFGIMRDGEKLELTVTIGDRNEYVQSPN